MKSAICFFKVIKIIKMHNREFSNFQYIYLKASARHWIETPIFFTCFHHWSLRLKIHTWAQVHAHMHIMIWLSRFSGLSNPCISHPITLLPMIGMDLGGPTRWFSYSYVITNSWSTRHTNTCHAHRNTQVRIDRKKEPCGLSLLLGPPAPPIINLPLKTINLRATPSTPLPMIGMARMGPICLIAPS